MIVIARRPELGEALKRRSVVTPDTPVLHPADAELSRLAEQTVVGSVAPRIAVAASRVLEPRWQFPPTRGRRGPFSVDEIAAAFRGYGTWQCTEVAEVRKATRITRRDLELILWIRTQGLAMPGAPVHRRPQRRELRDHIPIGVMSLEVAAAAHMAISVSLDIPREWNRGPLTYQQINEWFERVIRYRVTRA